MVDIRIVGILSGFVLVAGTIYYLLWIRDLGKEKIEKVRRRYALELIDGIFGPTADIDVVSDSEFESNIKREADNAGEYIDRISIHMYTVDRIEEENLKNPNIEHRILLLKPIYEGEVGNKTGFGLLRNAYFEENPDLSSPSKFSDKFGSIYKNITEEKWKNVEIRLYETTPWLRCALIDGHYGGVIIVPTLYGGREATKFWTQDSQVVESFETIFEDIWTDPRTEPLVDWYEENDINELEP